MIFLKVALNTINLNLDLVAIPDRMFSFDFNSFFFKKCTYQHPRI